MSHHGSDPGGIEEQPQLVPYVRLSSDGTFTYQCSFECRYSCVGDQKCTGKKVPIMSAGPPPTPPKAIPVSASASIPAASQSARSPATVAVVTPRTPVKPIPEINQVLMRTGNSPLDQSSPSTQELMKG